MTLLLLSDKKLVAGFMPVHLGFFCFYDSVVRKLTGACVQCYESLGHGEGLSLLFYGVWKSLGLLILISNNPILLL